MPRLTPEQAKTLRRMLDHPHPVLVVPDDTPLEAWAAEGILTATDEPVPDWGPGRTRQVYTLTPEGRKIATALLADAT